MNVRHVLRWFAGSGLAISVVILAGCSSDKPKLAAVTGKVSFKNEPVTAGAIYLRPAEGNNYKQDDPSGILELDGSFKVKSYPHGDGVPPGNYKVYLTPGTAARIGRPIYGDPAKTPWTLDVPATGVADKVFEVK